MNVKDVNDTFPIGTKVRFYPVSGETTYENTTIRSEAWELGHGEIVIKVNGRAGGVIVSHLVKVNEDEDEKNGVLF